jgi:hypothetical protein
MRGLIVALILFAAPALAEVHKSTKCLPSSAPQTQTLVDATGKTVQKVLCCCPVGNGQQCCGYATFCGGGYVQGCFCQ